MPPRGPEEGSAWGVEIHRLLPGRRGKTPCGVEIHRAAPVPEELGVPPGLSEGGEERSTRGDPALPPMRDRPAKPPRLSLGPLSCFLS